jgi:hypothetical protein
MLESLKEGPMTVTAPVAGNARPILSSSERQAKLSGVLQRELEAGWRIESQTEFGAVLVKGSRVNHILHLLLTVFTLGLWIIVWALLALTGGEKRRMYRVDEYGNVESRAL